MDLYTNDQQSLGNTTLKQHMLKTYTWMFLGVLITFATAFLVGNSSLVYYFYSTPLPLVMLIAQIGVVVTLVTRLLTMKESTAKMLFIAYSVMTGFTFSSLGYAYLKSDIALAFAMATIFFGCLVVIGSTTKMDLSKIGSMCIAGLLAFIIFQVLAMVFGWGYDVVLYSIIGLLLFTGITAWDVQKARKLYMANEGNQALLNKLSIYSAFDLYLDFINIFIYILRILGSRD